MKKKSAGYKPFKSFQGDTVAYINKNFVEKQGNYIGKPFSVFLNDFEIPIKSYLLNFGRTEVNDISISEYDTYTSQIKIMYDKNSLLIRVGWTKSISFADAGTVLAKNKGVWTEDNVKLFGGCILNRLDMRDYAKKRD